MNRLSSGQHSCIMAQYIHYDDDSEEALATFYGLQSLTSIYKSIDKSPINKVCGFSIGCYANVINNCNVLDKEQRALGLSKEFQEGTSS